MADCASIGLPFLMATPPDEVEATVEVSYIPENELQKNKGHESGTAVMQVLCRASLNLKQVTMIWVYTTKHV